MVLKNKTAKELYVRIPLWVDQKAVRCTLDKQETAKAWFGNYLRFRNLKSETVLTIQFPLTETTEQWKVDLGSGAKTYTCRFKGNTLVEISPPLVEEGALYARRAQFLKNEAPMKKVSRYVTAQRLQW